jgi:ATP-dependent DNA helicase RecG
MSDIANAFFRAGEHRALLGGGRLPQAAHQARRAQRASQIESWGRGIQRIFEACRAGGAPEPVLNLSGHDLWTEFPYSEQYLAALVETPEKTSVETSVEILNLLLATPKMTLSQVAAKIGRSVRAIEMAAAKLTQEGKLRRVGPKKGGHWEVLK